MKYMINRYLHAFECNLGIIARGNGSRTITYPFPHAITVEPLLTDPPRGAPSPRNGHSLKHRLKVP